MGRHTSSYRGRGGHRNHKRRFNRRRKPDINIAGFIKKSQENQSKLTKTFEVNRQFTGMQLHTSLQSNLTKQGFHTPTPIQDRVFDQISQGQDVLGIANTGTGKTGAFLIPLLNQQLRSQTGKILVVAPTRELALQINQDFKSLTQRTKLYSVLAIGGTNPNRQVQHLKRRYQAVIGTPGRIIDLAKRKVLDLSQFKLVVLDEVDRMLDMGFVNDIRKILQQTPQDRQSLYFSATVDHKIKNLIREFSGQVYTASVKTNETAAMVDQQVVRFQDTSKKFERLHQVLSQAEVKKTLIFGRTKRGVKKLMFALRDRGFRADSMHGNKSQNQRQRALRDFRHNKVEILVATDVAARGLDVDDVTHVINYEIPDSFDDYVHRIGRTGRAGKRGVAYTFVR